MDSEGLNSFRRLGPRTSRRRGQAPALRPVMGSGTLAGGSLSCTISGGAPAYPRSAWQGNWRPA